MSDHHVWPMTMYWLIRWPYFLLFDVVLSSRTCCCFSCKKIYPDVGCSPVWSHQPVVAVLRICSHHVSPLSFIINDSSQSLFTITSHYWPLFFVGNKEQLLTTSEHNWLLLVLVMVGWNHQKGFGLQLPRQQQRAARDAQQRWCVASYKWWEWNRWIIWIQMVRSL